mmetsp:Transcript_14194/g.47934  ORF Transcript_14194/g.47934 Transcript_14194/m.47934 type:complete len:344 (-) Transcript_14194:13-1044(-)
MADEDLDLAPDSIHCSDQVFDVACHPSVHVAAAGCVNGAVEVYRYHTFEPCEQLLSLQVHESSVRSLAFEKDGLTLYSASSDHSLIALNTEGSPVWGDQSAHDEALNRMEVLAPGILATGDDVGCVKLWDMRARSSVAQFHVHEDYISGMAYDQERATLVCVSGDATLSAINVRQQSLEDRSVEQVDEMHSVTIIKNGRKVVCGTQDGVLLVFSWGKWNDRSHAFPGHPHSVDTMLAVDANTICTGSSDGLIRVVQVQPDRVLGVLGDHEDFPVEGMRFSHDRSVMVSYAHDETVRFWDSRALFEDAEEGGDDDDDDDDGESKRQQALERRLRTPSQRFFSDL